jgi:hypothetical protein
VVGVKGKAPEVLVIVKPEPPTKYPGVPEIAMPEPAVIEEVAIEETPAPPFDITSWPAVRAEVVEMPQ